MSPEEARVRAEINWHRLAALGMSMCVDLHERNGDRAAARRCRGQGLAHLAESERLTATLKDKTDES